jgi:hypothetical protein
MNSWRCKNDEGRGRRSDRPPLDHLATVWCGTSRMARSEKLDGPEKRDRSVFESRAICLSAQTTESGPVPLLSSRWPSARRSGATAQGKRRQESLIRVFNCRLVNSRCRRPRAPSSIPPARRRLRSCPQSQPSTHRCQAPPPSGEAGQVRFCEAGQLFPQPRLPKANPSRFSVPRLGMPREPLHLADMTTRQGTRGALSLTHIRVFRHHS